MGEQWLRMVRAGMIGGGLAAMLLSASAMLRAQKPIPIPHLDIDRYRGTWYEIARLPIKREKNCVSDAIELVAEGDKPHQLQLVDSCRLKDGSAEVSTYPANAADKSGSGRYKVRTLWPFSRKYWVLATAPGYDWVLVGTPNHKNLWIYSRTSSLSPDLLTQAKSQATAQGFTLIKLIMTPQSTQK